MDNIKTAKHIGIFANTTDVRRLAYNAGLCEDQKALDGLRKQYPAKRIEINREWTRGAICALESNGDSVSNKHKVLILALKSLENKA